jgi:CHAD domain-containing protein
VNDVLAGEAAVDGLARWTTWLGRSVDPAGERTIGPLVAKRVARAQRTVLTAGRAIEPDTPAEAVHDLRKDAKRLRYELECFGGLFEPDALKVVVDQLKALQDNLGAFQDAEVQLGYLRLIEPDIEVDDRPALADLRAGVRSSAQAARDELAERFARYDTDANAAAFAALVASISPSAGRSTDA